MSLEMVRSVIVEQTGDGDPLLLIHGTGGTRGHWDAARDHLAAQPRLLPRARPCRTVARPQSALSEDEAPRPVPQGPSLRAAHSPPDAQSRRPLSALTRHDGTATPDPRRRGRGDGGRVRRNAGFRSPPRGDERRALPRRDGHRLPSHHRLGREGAPGPEGGAPTRRAASPRQSCDPIRMCVVSYVGPPRARREHDHRGGAMSKPRIEVVGGGLAGMVAGIEWAEQGGEVVLHEGGGSPGGRARSTEGPFRANFGPHALYKGRSNWVWLVDRNLLPPTGKPAAPAIPHRSARRLRRVPPFVALRAFVTLRHEAPLDRDFHGWASGHCGEQAAEILCAWRGPFTFH